VKKIKEKKIKMEKKIEIKNTKEIELKGSMDINIDQYIGQEVLIDIVEEYQSEYNGKPTYYIKILTQEILIMGEKGDLALDESGKPIQIRASKLFGLQKDSEGNIGWGKETKLGNYLKSKKVEHYKDLKGKSVRLQKTEPKNGKEYLTFV
jgi:hypothetical protein